MRPSIYLLTTVAIAAVSLAGCASSSDGLLPNTTGTLPKATADATKKRAEHNAMCMALRDRIISLRADGTIGKVEKAAKGKSRSVRVKRAALAKVAELNQANAEYQLKCTAHSIQAGVQPAPAKKTSSAKPKNTVAATNLD
jgi:hypothetical protein